MAEYSEMVRDVPRVPEREDRRDPVLADLELDNLRAALGFGLGEQYALGVAIGRLITRQDDEEA